jgi:hypothetical protein
MKKERIIRRSGKKRTKEVVTTRRTDLCKEGNGINSYCCILLPSSRPVLSGTFDEFRCYSETRTGVVTDLTLPSAEYHVA